MEVYDLIGYAGSIIVLVLFGLNQLDRLSSKSIWYDSLNVLGSIMLGVYSIYYETWPFLILNVVWGLIAARDVVKTLLSKKH
jgi:hypothetical protein